MDRHRESLKHDDKYARYGYVTFEDLECLTTAKGKHHLRSLDEGYDEDQDEDDDDDDDEDKMLLAVWAPPGSTL